MKRRLLLDTYALLAYLKKENSFREVRDALSSGETACAMSEINVGEAYYILSRRRGREAAEYFLEAILPSLPIKVVPADFKLIIEAARLKAEYPISYADCFALATAISEKAALMTGDREFRKAENLIEVVWL